ncbi:hypothetical protein AXG93_3017s1030 [Marchantia polymorpha subsp. ruderalis]|uniref:Uncharacterized protein n=1 Tax=Marchantia polymorpha subsp. ruderalis TaxID=1480154 RepID=A0A176WI74_MARPO|nr:hypothetical protein AXG93_3017s1030 [Marchantia polymorpha subsp. ruderalis]
MASTFPFDITDGSDPPASACFTLLTPLPLAACEQLSTPSFSFSKFPSLQPPAPSATSSPRCLALASQNDEARSLSRFGLPNLHHHHLFGARVPVGPPVPSRSGHSDSEVVASAVVDTTNDEVSHPTEAASSVDTTVTETRDEDMNVSPCYATVAESQIEGRSEAPDADDDLTLVEVDCRRMLADYDPPKSNTNPKKRGLLEVSTELGVSEATTEPSTYSTAL